MLKLGHIVYSNTFPPHAGIVTKNVMFPFELVEGIPTELNRLLNAGEIDVSPSSSIEYAMHPGRYVLLPNLSISARNRVRSIILQSRVPIEDLDGKTVALTNASATSVLLLRIVLERQRNLRPRYVRFEQGREDPFTHADAALFIGDVALRLSLSPGRPSHLYDLGALWHEFTGLPSVFALWQVNYREEIENDLAALYDILMLSKDYGLSHIAELAGIHAERFGIPESLLIEYWKSINYDFGEDERKGLLAYYGYAAELGAIKPVTELRFWQRR